jgi:hypothetical protein
MRASVLDCGGTTPLSPGATCHAEPERGHVRALQTEIVSPSEVREQFKKVKPLKDISVKQRG